MDSENGAAYPFLLFRGHYYKHTEVESDPPGALEVDLLENILDGDLKHCLDGSLLPLRKYTLANPEDLSDMVAVTKDGKRHILDVPIQLVLFGHHFVSDPSVPRGAVRFTHDHQKVGPTDLHRDISFIYAYHAHKNRFGQKYIDWIKKTWSRMARLFSRR